MMAIFFASDAYQNILAAAAAVEERRGETNIQVESSPACGACSSRIVPRYNYYVTDRYGLVIIKIPSGVVGVYYGSFYSSLATEYK